MPKFSEPATLRAIDPATLRSFLQPYHDYFTANGIDLSDAVELEYEELGRLLRSPPGPAPSELIDALYLVHECSSQEDADALLGAAAKIGLMIDDTPAPTCQDTAMRAWLLNPELLRERHAQAIAWRQRKYHYFRGPAVSSRTIPIVAPAAIDLLQATLDEWFDSNGRGTGCHAYAFRTDETLTIVVRHGLRKVREASQEDDGSSGVAYYRPQRHDVVVYELEKDSLGVHADTLGERHLYRQAVGRVVFNHVDYFSKELLFTLAPLVDQGEDALLCEDIDGLESIRLVEIRRVWGGAYREVETRRADDIFAAFRARDHPVGPAEKLVTAVFKVKFADSAKERSVTIRPNAHATYQRNEDSHLIERWLARRGFMGEPPRMGNADEDAAPALQLS